MLMTCHSINMNKTIWNKIYLKQVIDTLPDKKNKYYILMDRPSQRSIQQNSFLHAIFAAMWEEIWYPMEFMKETLKQQFLYDEIESNGVTLKRVKSTAKLTKKEFSDFIENIKEYAIEYIGMDIPDPDSDRSIEFMNQYNPY